jgi:hypothetical protein
MRTIHTPLPMHNFRTMSKERQCYCSLTISRVGHVVIAVYRELHMYGAGVAAHYTSPHEVV